MLLFSLSLSLSHSFTLSLGVLYRRRLNVCLRLDASSWQVFLNTLSFLFANDVDDVDEAVIVEVVTGTQHGVCNGYFSSRIKWILKKEKIQIVLSPLYIWRNRSNKQST